MQARALDVLLPSIDSGNCSTSTRWPLATASGITHIAAIIRRHNEMRMAPSRQLVHALPYRSSLNPGMIVGRAVVFATNQPVRYIHCVMRVSFA